MRQSERDQLIDELLEGLISEADFVRLEAEFHVDAAARQTYYKRLALHALLETEAEENRGSLRDPVKRHWMADRSRTLAIAAALLLLIGGSVMIWMERPTEKGMPTVEALATGYGVVAGQSDAVWGNERTLRDGDLLPVGELELKQGTVRLELFSGVTVIIEGEATFDVTSQMEMHVSQGKVRAHVPEPAQGFRIRTANGEVVDLGTEFAMEVTSEYADFHVLDGEIEWHPAEEAPRLLKEGEALRWESDRGASPLTFDAKHVVGIADLEKSLADQRQNRRETWVKSVAKRAADSRLLLYYPMTSANGESRQLLDASVNGIHGALVRADRTLDRWHHAAAGLDFSPTGSRVRVTVPGIHTSLTLYCWVRIDSLDRLYNSLFLTDGHELHEPHWQIMNDGRLFFSVKAHERHGRGNPDKHICFSPPIWNPALSGQWLQIATTYDGHDHVVTHYVNGEAVSREALPADKIPDRVVIGGASIGNWSQPKRDDPEFAVRHLNGVIDEFAIYSEVLTPAEIQSFYQLGKP